MHSSDTSIAVLSLRGKKAKRREVLSLCQGVPGYKYLQKSAALHEEQINLYEERGKSIHQHGQEPNNSENP